MGLLKGGMSPSKAHLDSSQALDVIMVVSPLALQPEGIKGSLSRPRMWFRLCDLCSQRGQSRLSVQHSGTLDAS